jgi:chemotaxis protein CheX
MRCANIRPATTERLQPNENMTQTIQLPNVCDFMSRHLVDVFETMLSMKAAPAMHAGLPIFDGRVTGAVGFAGENVTGAVYLNLAPAFATKVAAGMLGLAPEEITGENEVNDVVGEAANMLAGGLKSWLCDAGAECAISTPAIIRGNSFAIEPMPGVAREWLVFECGKDFIVVEIHLKLG